MSIMDLTAEAAAPQISAPGSVELRSLTKVYGTAVAVDNVSLTVQAGEFLSLLGPSGCGKTTTLRLIGGFEFPDDGSIQISGCNVEDLPPHKRPVNTVFQAYALFPHMKVADNVAYGLRLSGVPKSEIADRVSRALDQKRSAPARTRELPRLRLTPLPTGNTAEWVRAVWRLSAAPPNPPVRSSCGARLVLR